MKLRFEPLSGPNRCGEQPAGALHHPSERIRKSLIFKHLLFIVAGSGAHYREIETGVNTYSSVAVATDWFIPSISPIRRVTLLRLSPARLAISTLSRL